MNRVSGPRIPGSEHIPFRPMNPWGKAPVVTRQDGSVIDWKSPLREPLFQVRVDDADKGDIPIGPKLGLAVCEELCAATKLAIKDGRIRGWSNPHVVSAPPERAVARVF